MLLQGLLRRPDLPAAARHALRLESGLNDVVLLPIVLVALAFLGTQRARAGARWARLGLDLFLLGPGAGVLVGLFGLATLDLVRRRVGVRRDYESLYSLGIAFAAYAAAESVHGSGFLAAFAAGLTIAAFDVELCDCFQEYGETTAELALLLTFVLLGSSLIWSGLALATGPTLRFVALVLLARPVIYLAAFAPHADRTAGAADRRMVRPARSLVAAAGAAAGVRRRARGRRDLPRRLPRRARLHPRPRRHADVDGAPRTQRRAGRCGAPARPIATSGAADAVLITVAEVQALLAAGAPVVPLDVRREEPRAESDFQAKGSLRLAPQLAVADARRLGLPADAWVVAYCTCPAEETSGRVARDLIRNGWPRARALVGGFAAWRAAGLPVEPVA